MSTLTTCSWGPRSASDSKLRSARSTRDMGMFFPARFSFALLVRFPAFG
jgi:hypothetical protein